MVAPFREGVSPRRQRARNPSSRPSCSGHRRPGRSVHRQPARCAHRHPATANVTADLWPSGRSAGRQDCNNGPPSTPAPGAGLRGTGEFLGESARARRPGPQGRDARRRDDNPHCLPGPEVQAVRIECFPETDSLYVDDAAQLREYFRLVVSVTPATHQAWRAAHAASIRFGPLHDLHAVRAVFRLVASSSRSARPTSPISPGEGQPRRTDKPYPSATPGRYAPLARSSHPETGCAEWPSSCSECMQCSKCSGDT